MSRFANSRIHQPVDNSLHRLSPGGVYVDLSESTKQRERSNKLLALHERASTSYLARRAHKQGRHTPVHTDDNLGPTELSHNLDHADLQATRSFHRFPPHQTSHIPALCKRNGKQKFVRGLKERMVARKAWMFSPEVIPKARDIDLVIRPQYQTGMQDSLLMSRAFI